MRQRDEGGAEEVAADGPGDGSASTLRYGNCDLSMEICPWGHGDQSLMFADVKDRIAVLAFAEYFKHMSEQ